MEQTFEIMELINLELYYSSESIAQYKLFIPEMLALILVTVLGIVMVALFFMVVKPYYQVLSLKRGLQKQGLKVKLFKINFFKASIIQVIEQYTETHSDALYFLKYDFQGYDVAIMNIFNNIFILPCSIEVLKQSYKQIEKIEKSDLVEKSLARIYGGGIVMQEGKVWKQKRKLYSQIFNYSLLQDIFPTLCSSISESIESWKQKSKLDSLVEFQSAFFKSFIVSYFGEQFKDFSYKGKSYEQCLVGLFGDIFNQTFSIQNLIFGTKFLEKGLTKTDREIIVDLKVFKEATKGFVKLKYQQYLNKESASQKTIIFKIFQKLNLDDVSEQEKEQIMESITGDVATFFFAGTDTSASTLAALLRKVQSSPDIIDKMRSEFAAIQHDLTFDKIRGLKYMEATINETLRMYGPANWIFDREVKKHTQDIKIADTLLPKGSFLAIQSQTVHYDPQFYDKPDEFNPQRWFKRNSENNDPYSFISFGAGQRNCIGQHLARVQMKVALGKILSKYDFSFKKEFKMGLPFIYSSQNNEMQVKPRK